MKLSLSTREILHKQFNVSNKGYDPLEVDQFLDIVLSDYKLIEEVVNNLNNEIKELKTHNVELRDKITYLENITPTTTVKQNFSFNDYAKLDNLELLKKISKYEIKLYELGVDPSKIK